MVSAGREQAGRERSSREGVWAEWMTAALDGDGTAYRRLLAALTPVLRANARRTLSRMGAPTADAEDIVQETLLALHLHRHTWRRSDPIGPWVTAIARYKLIDALRRRGRRAEVTIDDLVDALPDAADQEEELGRQQAARLVETLDGRQGEVVRAISLQGADIKETATKLGMSEGAVRVALHRGLKALARMYKASER
jgi:RNA polymerase sigma factor (sigma-70 family)